jgi:glycerate 2-kinase
MDTVNLKKTAVNIVNTAIKSVDPYNLILEQIKREGDTLRFAQDHVFDLNAFKRIFVIGAGKGSASMARGMEKILANDLNGGSVVVKYGHGDDLQKIHLFEAGHPIPDENTLHATGKLLENIKYLNRGDCVFVLLTGGGSALLELLPESLRLDDLQKLNAAMLKCGATIHEINCVRKHISRIKGGQLARYINPAICITLVLSDVIGDDLSVIASGPTSPDPSTFDEALNIIEKYKIGPDLSPVLVDHLQKGKSGEIEETPKPGDRIFESVHNIVIGSNRLALQTAQKAAERAGFNTVVLTSLLEGEARHIAKVIGGIIREIQETGNPVSQPACLLLGGEPTVHIKGKGKGGRNQELALAVALTDILQPYIFISCGSDGTDGPTDAAGAVVSEKTLKRAETIGISASEYLEHNDSYNFFSQLDDLIITGPTGTNVMDLMLALVP